MYVLLYCYCVSFKKSYNLNVMASKKAFYKCSVDNCKNTTRNSEYKFYSFPTKNPMFPEKVARRLAWITALKKQESNGSSWSPRKHNKICSYHFAGSEKSEDLESPSYNPTVFNNCEKTKVNAEITVNRYKRRLKRSLSKIDSPQIEVINRPTREASKILVNEGSIDESAVNEYPQSNAATQVSFDTEEVERDIFICIKYTFGSTCDAEIQAYRPLPKKVANISDFAPIDQEASKIFHTETKKGFYGYSSLTNAQDMKDLAGVIPESFQLFLKILSREKTDDRMKVSLENRLLLFLMKMKYGLSFTALGILFQIHRTTVSKIFYKTLLYLTGACRNFVTWPSREAVQLSMPEIFKPSYKDCRVIIDCTEFHVEQASQIKNRVRFYSNYKRGFRIKVLVGCTPSGYISFVSRCYGGRSTDAQITSTCGFLDLLESGDVVLADKGFPQIKTLVDNSGRGVLVVMPPFLSKNNSFTEEEVEETYRIASVRIHVERVMQRIRTFKIVDKITTKMLPYCDAIIFMCCVLVNLQPPIIKVNIEDDQE